VVFVGDGFGVCIVVATPSASPTDDPTRVGCACVIAQSERTTGLEPATLTLAIGDVRIMSGCVRFVRVR